MLLLVKNRVSLAERNNSTFSVVAEAHLGLAEANGIFALANAIEFLELCLVDALGRVLAAHSRTDVRRWDVLTWLGK